MFNFYVLVVQCEDLYELISCLLPEVTASPAQHCTYQIFGTKQSRFRSSLFAILFLLCDFCVRLEERGDAGRLFLGRVVDEILCFLGKWVDGQGRCETSAFSVDGK